MSDPNTDNIFTAARRYDLPLPKAVTEATATRDAARTLAAKVANETAPDLTGLTAKTLTATYELALAWELRDARMRVAQQLVAVAESALDNEMFISAQELYEPLAGLFARAGEDFVRALTDLGGNVDVASVATSPTRAEAYGRLTTATADLDFLRSVRAAYSPRGNRADCGSDLFEEVSRCLVVTDTHKLHRNPLRGSDIEFWSEAVERGYRIKWQDRAEQEANAAAARPGPTAYAARAPDPCDSGVRGCGPGFPARARRSTANRSPGTGSPMTATASRRALSPEKDRMAATAVRPDRTSERSDIVGLGES